MKHPFLSRLASHFVPKLTGRVQRTATWPGVRDGWTDWPIWDDYQYVCCICVCACLHKTAYHYCITCTRYIKLLHTVEICKNTLANACLISYIHIRHTWVSRMSVRRLGTTINGQRVWVGDVRSIRFLLKSFSVTPCWGNGLRDNQAAGLLAAWTRHSCSRVS